MAQRCFWGMVAGVLMLVLVGLAAAVRAEAPPVAYVGLKYDLVRHGLDKDYVFQTFDDPRNSFLPDVVKKIAFLGKESQDIYEKFLTPAVAAQGRAYIQAHRATLSRAEAQYGVAPEVIVGILTVECGLGSNTGKYPVFNVFASLAVMDTPEIIEDLDLGSAGRDRLKKKAAWARRELPGLSGILRRPPPGPLFLLRLLGRGHGLLPVPALQPEELRRLGQRQRAGGPVHPRRRHLFHRLLPEKERLPATEPGFLAPGRAQL